MITYDCALFMLNSAHQKEIEPPWKRLGITLPTPKCECDYDDDLNCIISIQIAVLGRKITPCPDWNVKGTSHCIISV